MITLLPAIAIMFVLSVLYGALFHLWKGDNWRDLGAYILLALLGFLVGQLIGTVLQLSVLKLGQVHLIAGSLFAWLLMFAFAWLKG